MGLGGGAWATASGPIGSVSPKPSGFLFFFWCRISLNSRPFSAPLPLPCDNMGEQ